MISLIDSHAHLDHLDDLPAAMAAADRAGVAAVVAMSVDLTSMKKTLAIAGEFGSPKVYCALGVHPGNLKPEERDATLAFLRDNASRAVAVGEIGLDYWYKWARKDKQQRALQQDIFRRQLMIAKEFDLPAVIHSRGAWKDCLAIAREVGVRKAEFHWYTGPVDILEEILKEGYYISTGPSLAYSEPLREIIRNAPPERVMLETDAPVAFRDGEQRFSATPKDVRRALQAYSALLGQNEAELARQTFANTVTFFKLNELKAG